MIKFMNEAYTAFICIGIVLLLIVILIIILANGQKRISEKLDRIVPDAKRGKPLESMVSRDDEVIAVIAAAVASVLGKSASSIRVRSIRRLESSAPAWAVAGRQDVMNSRF